jgi:hypothetical protein
VKPKDVEVFEVDPITKRPTVPFFLVQQYLNLNIAAIKEEAATKTPARKRSNATAKNEEEAVVGTRSSNRVRAKK